MKNFTNIIELLQYHQTIKLTFFVVIGLCIGSFLNVVIYRLPIMLERKWHKLSAEILGVGYNKPDNYPDKFNLLTPPSNCLNCGVKVKLVYNIPLIGYFFTKGRCSNCGNKLALQYLLVESITGVVFGITAFFTYDLYLLLTKLVFISICLSVIVIDFKTFLIPDELTKPLLWLGLLVNIHGLIAGSLVRALIGIVTGFLLLWSINFSYKLITKKDGMGEGDFIFLAAILAWLGIDGFIPVLLLSSIFGILYFLMLLIFNKIKLTNPIPFGPFLGIAGILVLIFSQYVLNVFPF